jgi:PilZ domain
MSTTMTDRRRSHRYQLVFVTIVEHLDQPRTMLSGLTADLSTCGCFVDVLNPMLVGTKVRIKLHWGQEAFETTGKVASVDPGHGMGLEFTKQISIDQLDVLERWLAGERN